MEQKKKEQIALFRFGVISAVVSLREAQRGEREKKILEITQAEWDIPHSSRSYICRSTVMAWIKRYEQGGRRLEALYPQERSDSGACRTIDPETEVALIGLKRQSPHCSLMVLLQEARDKKILPADFKVSPATLYRLLERHRLNDTGASKDRRKFEAELSNDLWQTDCMHGPLVSVNGKRRKTYLFAILDDHSRLITHAEFYLRETVEKFINCFRKALQRRGLPGKLYLDNGPCFRSHQLRVSCARLGIHLVHAKAYCPQGKGKIERWFKTCRIQLLPTLSKSLTLEDLNEKLHLWIENQYHQKTHSSTGQKPLERFLKHLHIIREAPNNLPDYFRKEVKRKVAKDRTVSMNGKLYEAPAGLIDKTITLLFDETQSQEIEILFQEKSHGFLRPVDPQVNYRLRSGKDKKNLDRKISDSHPPLLNHTPSPQPGSGRLFGSES